MTSPHLAITATLTAYERALNTSDTDAVLRLYTDDGVFMPQALPTFAGTTAVRAAYARIFATITLAVTFTIDEIREIGDGWAFARTRSAGTQTIKASGARSEESNHELFVLQRVDGDWKIARYAFSTEGKA
jgi:uncharacterized protein (TIGR02246 family)